MSRVLFTLLMLFGAAMFLHIFLMLRPDLNSPPALQRRTESLWKHLQYVSSSQLLRFPDVYTIRLHTDRKLDELFPPNIVHRNIDSHALWLLLRPLTSLTSLSVSLHLFSVDQIKSYFRTGFRSHGRRSSWMLTLSSVDTESLEELQPSSTCWFLTFVQMGSKLILHTCDLQYFQCKHHFRNISLSYLFIHLSPHRLTSCYFIT